MLAMTSKLKRDADTSANRCYAAHPSVHLKGQPKGKATAEIEAQPKQSFLSMQNMEMLMQVLISMLDMGVTHPHPKAYGTP